MVCKVRDEPDSEFLGRHVLLPGTESVDEVLAQARMQHRHPHGAIFRQAVRTSAVRLRVRGGGDRGEECGDQEDVDQPFWMFFLAGRVGLAPNEEQSSGPERSGWFEYQRLT